MLRHRGAPKTGRKCCYVDFDAVFCWLKRCVTVKPGAISGFGPTTSMLSTLSLAAGPYSSQRNYSIPTVSTPFFDYLTCYYATFADILDLPICQRLSFTVYK
ncbi:hypothetical protein IAS59_005640 [Cryptococcus gattii]